MNVNILVAWKVFIAKGLNWNYIDCSSSYIKFRRHINYEAYISNAKSDLKEIIDWSDCLSNNKQQYKTIPRVFRFWPFKGSM